MKRLLSGARLVHLGSVLVGVTLCFPARPAAQSPSTTGLWSAVMTWPMVAVHAHLLPTGSVLAWSDYTDNGGAQVWNPSTNTFTVHNFPLVNLFCAGHALLPDGRLMITGGIFNNIDDVGPRETTIFDSSTNTWSQAGLMAVGRYYPTTTTLPDGRLLVQGGTTTCSNCIADIPEIYDPVTDRWTQMAASARMAFRYYPHTYVLPDGRVIVAAQNDQAIPTQVLDLSTQRWTLIDPRPTDGHSSAMYLPGKIIKAGKATADDPGHPALDTTYVLDMTQPSPAWQATAPMQFPRSYLNLTILPDGQVLATGGGTTTDKANFSTAVYEAELWSPTTRTWTTLARSAVPRLYHSTALLLPDGRVLVAGGGRTGCRPCVVPAPVDQQNAEIFSPPYLFKGPRPVIESAPPVVQYGDPFTVTTPDAARISTVSLIALGSVTHAFNETQRFVPLSFSAGTDSLTVQAPPSGNIAPPGPYMLFVVDSAGVPSVAAMTRVPAADATDPDLTLTKAHTGTFTQGQTGATYSLTVSNSGGSATSGAVTVDDTVPVGLTPTGIAGTGWTCTQPAGPCTRGDALAAAASYPVLTLTVTVATTAPSSVTNTATVSGGGETNTGNNTASDVTAINPTGTLSTISLVQHTSKDAGTTTSSTLAFPASNTAGNWIAVVIRAGQRGQVFTVTDTRGNTYRQAVQINQTVDTTTLAIYYAENVAGGPNTVTVAETLTGGTLRLAILEYSGVAAVNSLDVTAAAEGTGTAANSGTVTTTANGDLVLGFVVTANGTTVTAGSGFTIEDRVPTAGPKLATEDRRLPTAGPTAATATLGSSDPWGAAVATFRAGFSGPPPPPDLTIAKTHTGTFTQGQVGAIYTLTVTNQAGGGPTTGMVSVSDAVPIDLTATAIAGTGWTCTQPSGPCTRSDVLGPGASYPALALTVTVAPTAPSSVTNMTTVSGGGDTNTANNTATDAAIVSTPDTEPPSAPGTLTANAPNGTHVDLAWGPATDNVSVTGYRVERCAGVCTTEGFVKIAAPSATSFSDSGLTPNTTYSYIVRAVDSASNLGPYSNAATITTGSTIPELVAAYAFDEASGSAVTDLSGNGRTGTILNATRTTSAKYGMALQFNGTSAKVSIPDAPSLHLTSAMTLEAWVNPATVSAAWRDLLYKGNDNYYLMATAASGGGLPAAGGTLGGTNFNLFGNSLLPVNSWTHLATTYDGATLRMYVNGTQVSSAPRTGAFSVSTNALEIGGDAFYGQYFAGAIDEVRIYNIALAPSQIQADMLTPLGAATPVVSFSRSSIDFGSVATGSTSVIQNVTITNAGTASLTISGISITGPNSADFGQTNTCGVALAPSETCTVSATLTPTTTGSRNANLSVADNAPGTPHVVAVTGTGTGFAITPRVSVLTPTLSQQFALTGNSNGTPVWSVDGISGGDATVGTITETGIYTPPLLSGVHTVAYTDLTHVASATAYVTTYAGMLTHHNDTFRTGQNLGETVLTPQNVNSASFGKLFEYSLDGLSMASPLYVAGVNIPGQGAHNVVYVATQHDTVYALDADGRSSAPLWRVSFLGPGVTTVPSSDTGECCDIAPEIGITGTPVIDSSTNTLYVVAKTKEGSVYRQRLHALDLGTGTEKFGGPILIQASVPGTGVGAVNGMIPFNALRENQRPALLLSNGVVYIAFGSHGDVQPYHGWVLGYNAATLQQTMAANLSPTAEAGGIWQANGGPAGDGAGNIYVVTGNGTFDTSNTNRKNYGDSIVKLTADGAVVDFFTPHDQANINSNNFDLGAAGALLLPDQPGPHPHLMVSGGKNNTVYLVDRDNMGKYNSANDNQIVQSLVNVFPFGTPEPGNYSAPVYFNGTIYFGPIRDNIQAFRLTNGLLSATASDRTTDVFNYPGATMSISANGSSNGILWAIQRNGDCGVQLTCSSAAPGVLKAYSTANLGSILYSSDQIPNRDAFDFATKFSVPLVANGKVFVGSMGRLTVYGLLP